MNSKFPFQKVFIKKIRNLWNLCVNWHVFWTYLLTQYNTFHPCRCIPPSPKVVEVKNKVIYTLLFITDLIRTITRFRLKLCNILFNPQVFFSIFLFCSFYLQNYMQLQSFGFHFNLCFLLCTNCFILKFLFNSVWYTIFASKYLAKYKNWREKKLSCGSYNLFFLEKITRFLNSNQESCRYKAHHE